MTDQTPSKNDDEGHKGRRYRRAFDDLAEVAEELAIAGCPAYASRIRVSIGALREMYHAYGSTRGTLKVLHRENQDLRARLTAVPVAPQPVPFVPAR